MTAKSNNRRRRAIALIWTALCGLIFIGFVGLAVDTAHVFTSGQQLQAVADAASLAAAQRIQSNLVNGIHIARTYARDIAAANMMYGDPGLGVSLQLNEIDPVVSANADTTDGDIIVGWFDRNTQVFTPWDAASPSPRLDRKNAVRVIARRTGSSPNGALNLVFGPIVTAFAGTAAANVANVTREAIAALGAGTGSGLIILDPHVSCALDMGGNSSLTVQPVPPQTCEDGAGITVDSDSSTAACVPNNVTVKTTGMYINGGFNGNTGSVTEGNCGTVAGTKLVRADTGKSLPDPLAYVPQPSTSGIPSFPSPGKNNDTTLAPGWYPAGIDRNGGTLTLMPGVYIIGNNATGNATFNFAGNAALCGKGVMIYMMAGAVDITGGSSNKYLDPIDFSKPSTYFCSPAFSYPLAGINSNWQGITFFQSRSNTNQARITGSSALHMTGVLYFPNNQLRVGGAGFSLGTQVIVGSLQLAGGADVSISYDGRNPSAGAQEVFLVE